MVPPLLYLVVWLDLKVAVRADGQYSVVMEASGLRPEDVHLSTSHDRMQAHIDVHMRQFSRLLRALGAHESDVVGGEKAVPRNSRFRLILPLPQSVRAVYRTYPEWIDGFFIWNLLTA